MTYWLSMAKASAETTVTTKARGADLSVWDDLNHSPAPADNLPEGFRAVSVPGTEGALAPEVEGTGTGRERPAAGNLKIAIASGGLHRREPETCTTGDLHSTAGRATACRPHRTTSRATAERPASPVSAGRL